MIVAFDAGHGGRNEGCRSPSGLTREEDVMRWVAQYVKRTRSDIELIRQDDETLTLAQRGSRAIDLGASLVISGHLDSIPTASHKHGLHAYYPQDNILSRLLAEEAVKRAPRELRGGSAICAYGAAWKDRAENVLNAYLPMCDSMLIEFGYLSNTRDLAFVRSTEGVMAMGDLVIELADIYRDEIGNMYETLEVMS